MPFLKTRTAALVAKGDSARDRRDWPGAAVAYRRALRCDPTLNAVWVQYGHAVKEQGGLAEAERAYCNAIALDGQVADTHLQLGHALKLQSRMQAAAEAYLRALMCAPQLVDAREELVRLGWSTTRIARCLAETNVAPELAPAAAPPGSRLAVTIDASDLLYHFLEHGPIASGIQRVQLNLIGALLSRGGDEISVTIVSYVVDRRGWVEIPQRLYRDLTLRCRCRTRWEIALRELRLEFVAADPHRFAPQAALVNFGTSWWLPNYFVALRDAQTSAGVQLYHFIHDLIPAIHPEFCLPDLVRDFLPWIAELALHAQGFLVNSEATANDLSELFSRMGCAPPRRQIVRLDGPLLIAGDRNPGPDGGQRGLSALGVEGAFVLFVATLEVRKNHALAFAAWLRLIEARGADRLPLLVCVGRRGWLFDDADRMLRAEPRLADRIRMLSNVTDADLAELYRHAQFTIYPSACEGWGLPVSEALGHGRVPLVSDIPALREAGGEFAAYFDPSDPDDFDRQLRQLLDGEACRTTREESIARHYRPRSWTQIANETLQAITLWHRCATGQESEIIRSIAPLAPVLPLGVYLPLGRNRGTEPGSLVRGGAIYRVGSGWGVPDRFGCAMRQPICELHLRLADADREPCLLYLHVENTTDAELRLRSQAASGEWLGSLAPHARRCIPVRICAEAALGVVVTTTTELVPAGATEPTREQETCRLLGLYLGREADERGRNRFFECVALDELSSLTQGAIASAAKR